MKGPELGAKHHFDKVCLIYIYSVVLYKEEFVLFFKKKCQNAMYVDTIIYIKGL